MITINGDEIPAYPTDLNEDPSQVKTDTYAIDGTPSRMQGTSKKRAVLTYEAADVDTWRYWKALYDAAASVEYSNDESGDDGDLLEFTGILDISKDSYIRGGSRLAPLTVTISEGANAGGF